jgi:hypothetical protein
MRIHTDVITREQVLAALAGAQATGSVAGSVRVTRLSDQGSTKRSRSIDVALASARMRRDIPGLKYPWQATWVEWSWFIAHLYEVDGNAIIGPYQGKSDFREKTDSMALRGPFRVEVSA